MRRALACTLVSAAGCLGPAATGVDLSVRFDQALAVDQLAIAFTVDGAPSFDERRVPDVATPLDPSGAHPVVLLFDDALGGHRVGLFVDGLAAGAVVGSGDVEVTLVAGRREVALVELGSPQSCGDGEPRAGKEACDDGDADDGDGCSAVCGIEAGWTCDDAAPSSCVRETPCGDGTIDAGEECDDGDGDDDDGCSSLCRVESGWVCVGQPSSCARTCGDGVLDPGEACDDGDQDAGDGCSDVCVVEIGFVCIGAPSTCVQSCGSGALDTGEACDDGNLFSGDGCSGTCAFETGFTCSGQPSACAPLCGDGFVRGSELCDDGATLPDDGCDGLCRPERGFACAGEPSTCTETCGDGVLDPGEVCDDADLEDGDGCGATCFVEATWACSGAPSLCLQTCGNAELDAGEQCDDGASADGDGCSASCAVEAGFACVDGVLCAPVCGDGLLRGAEPCDDDNAAPGDGCDASCIVEAGYACAGEPSVCAATCGDGNLDIGEICDDGAVAAGDGCSPSCIVEPGFSCAGAPSVCAQTCGDTAVDPGEVCDDGNLVAGDGCTAGCAVEPGFTCPSAGGACAAVCGDRLLRGAETCDDGATSSGDGCTATCARETGFICDGEPSVCVPGCVINGSDVNAGALDQTNPCRACRPSIDPTATSAVDDGTPCSDGAYCNGVETCNGGTCGAGAAPCGGTLPVCNESIDACQCSGGSCDDGVFCNGGEACVGGACVEGTPPNCPAPTDRCDEVGARCVECLDSGDCAAPSPTCTDGSCVGGCSPGQHDGGDGVCVADGTCSNGYVRAYIDGDGDGIGAGPLTADCFPTPLGAGLSATDTDCNDGDGNVFSIQSVYFDDDGDGYTVANAQDDCLGASLPPTRTTSAAPPPYVSFEAGANNESGSGKDWSGSASRFGAQHVGGGVATSNLDDDPTSKELRLTSYGFAIPGTAQIRGVRVHVIRRGNVANAYQDAKIRLVVNSAPSGDDKASAAAWPTTLTAAEYGGPTDLWGLALTPAQVNATGFGAMVQVARNGAGNTATLDAVWIEVFTDQGGDCDDESSAVYLDTTSITDADADGYAPSGAASGSACVGSSMPAGVSQRSLGTDCYDASFSARPNASSYYSVNRGDGSFDYNCQNGEEREPVTEDVTCSCTTFCGAATTSTYTPTAACGASTSDDSCSGTCPTCTLQQQTRTTRCR